MQRLDSKQRPPGYEPGKLTTAPLCYKGGYEKNRTSIFCYFIKSDGQFPIIEWLLSNRSRHCNISAFRLMTISNWCFTIKLRPSYMVESVGFEPTELWRLNGFQDRRNKPLCQLSIGVQERCRTFVLCATNRCSTVELQAPYKLAPTGFEPMTPTSSGWRSTNWATEPYPFRGEL